MAASITERDSALAAFIRDTTWEDLPPQVREWALMCLMDNVASAIAGSTARATRIAESLVADLLPGDQATLLAGGRTASVLGAAFANAVAGNAYDIDDNGLYTWGHPGAQVFAAALAMGEKVGADGRPSWPRPWWATRSCFAPGGCWHDVDQPDLPRLRHLGLHRLREPSAPTCSGCPRWRPGTRWASPSTHSPSLPILAGGVRARPWSSTVSGPGRSTG